jgi:hypothetical protein
VIYDEEVKGIAPHWISVALSTSYTGRKELEGSEVDWRKVKKCENEEPIGINTPNKERE